jgi:sulfite reductase (ferredoxin)
MISGDLRAGVWQVRRSGLLADVTLPDEFRALRVRPDAGRLTTGQLSAVGDVSWRYAGDAVEVTGQQHVRLPRVRPADLPAAAARLLTAGLTPARPGEGTRHVFTGSPVAGVATDEIVDGTPALRAIRDVLACRPEFSGLPAGFRTAVSGSPCQDVLHEASDVSFVGVRDPRLGPGFDVWVGGMSLSPATAGRLGAFVTLDEVPEVWAGVVRAILDHGLRGPRGHARSRFTVSDWGSEKFRRVLETDYLRRRLASSPGLPPPSGPRDQLGVHAQRDGRCYVGVTPVTRPPGGTTMMALADLAETHGSTRLQVTPYQKLVILDIPPDRVGSLCRGLEWIGLTARPALLRRRGPGPGYR